MAQTRNSTATRTRSEPDWDLKEADVDLDLVARLPLRWMEEHMVLPIRREGTGVIVAMADHEDVVTRDETARRLGAAVKAVSATREQIAWWLEVLADRDEALELETLAREIPEGHSWDVEAELIEKTTSSAIVDLTTSIIKDAVACRATDIHLVPTRLETRVLYRIDGRLENIAHVDAVLRRPLVSRLKIMANLDISVSHKPQDGRFTTRIGRHIVDVRMAARPTIHDEKIVMRLLNKSAAMVRFGGLGMSPQMEEKLIQMMSDHRGLILATGPTGSGKSTTLYVALHQLRGQGLSIDTIEDPVEVQLNGVGQSDVTQWGGAEPAEMLRSILRQDPDVIMVSEIRDLKVAEVAFHAALSGHLVLSTLHTRDCVGTVTRLRDLGVPQYAIASGLSGVVTQRLARRLCPDCRVRAKTGSVPTGDIPGLTKWEREHDHHISRGCSGCNNRGYRGRVGVFQLLELNPEIQNMILEGARREELEEAAGRTGMRSLLSDGMRHVQQGNASLEEILAVCMS